MNIGILGTGNVGQIIGTRLIRLGHHVWMGSRSKDNPNAASWAKKAGKLAASGHFAEAAENGEILFNCTSGLGTLPALGTIKNKDLENKVLIDVANPLDFSNGMPPVLSVCNNDSLGEQIQRNYPALKVVKALNTMNADIMVNPELVSEAHDVFICGNDLGAKASVSQILIGWFGWESVIDLGDITKARGMEMMLPVWISLWEKIGTGHFNFHIAR